MTDFLEVRAVPPPLAPPLPEELFADEELVLEEEGPDLSQPVHFPGQMTWARPTFVQPWTWVTPQ